MPLPWKWHEAAFSLRQARANCSACTFQTCGLEAKRKSLGPLLGQSLASISSMDSRVFGSRPAKRSMSTQTRATQWQRLHISPQDSCQCNATVVCTTKTILRRPIQSANKHLQRHNLAAHLPTHQKISQGCVEGFLSTGLAGRLRPIYLDNRAPPQ